MSDLKKAVKIAAAKKGLKMYEVAEKIGKSPSGLTLLLSGNPTKENIDKLAVAFDMKTSELMALGE